MIGSCYRTLRVQTTLRGPHPWLSGHVPILINLTAWSAPGSKLLSAFGLFSQKVGNFLYSASAALLSSFDRLMILKSFICLGPRDSFELFYASRARHHLLGFEPMP
jgi:hypothetical protein